MYDYYGIYASCRDAAWRCQIDFNICSLPVKVHAIAKRAGIRIIKNKDVSELRAGEYGVSINDGYQWTIIYDDRMSLPESRLVVAHELGHIFLGHEYRYPISRFAFNTRRHSFEREADMFAVRLLAPAFVLHELKIIDADGIATLCGIPMSVALERSRRMSVLESRSRYYSSPLEKRLRERFLPWITAVAGGEMRSELDETSDPEPEITAVIDREHPY